MKLKFKMIKKFELSFNKKIMNTSISANNFITYDYVFMLLKLLITDLETFFRKTDSR